MNVNKLRGALLRRKQATTSPPLDVESALHQLTEIRAKIPYLENAARPVEDGLTRSSDGMPLQTIVDFEFSALKEALAALGDDISAALARGAARAQERALQTHSAVEDLSCDPEPEVFMKLLDEMREVFEMYFGESIPGEA
jgi:hypothetical protein